MAETLLPGASATARFVHVAPRKSRRVIDLIRGLKATEALAVLQFAPQSASEPVFKVLQSAMANAENNERLDREVLFVDRAYVDEGPTLKRFRPRAQGRAFRIRKRTSHITVSVVARPATTSRATGRTTPSTKTPSTKTPTTQTPTTQTATTKGRTR